MVSMRKRGTRLKSPTEENFRKRFFDLVKGQKDKETAALLGVDPSYITHLKHGRRFSEAMKRKAVAQWPELAHYVWLDMTANDGDAA